MKAGMVNRNLWLQPRFKALKPQEKLAYLYLLTCPLSNSAHLFRLGPEEVAIGCGITPNRAREMLSQFDEAGLIAYDFEHEMVWLESQMVTELGAEMKPGDKRIAYLRKLVEELPECALTADFIARYGSAYHLLAKGACKAASKGASKPLRSQYQDQYQSPTARKDDPPTELAVDLPRARGEKVRPAGGGT